MLFYTIKWLFTIKIFVDYAQKNYYNKCNTTTNAFTVVNTKQRGINIESKKQAREYKRPISVNLSRSSSTFCS